MPSGPSLPPGASRERVTPGATASDGESLKMITGIGNSLLHQASRAGQPPSTGMIAPVTKEARSAARDAATSACSRACPARPSVAFEDNSRNTSGATVWLRSVRVNPGASTFAPMLLRPYWTATALVIAWMPAFAPLYMTGARSSALMAATEETLTMEPPPVWSMARIACFMHRSTPFRFTAFCTSYSSRLRYSGDRPAGCGDVHKDVHRGRTPRPPPGSWLRLRAPG